MKNTSQIRGKGIHRRYVRNRPKIAFVCLNLEFLLTISCKYTILSQFSLL